MVRTSSGQLLNQQLRLEAHSACEATLPVDGKDFFVPSPSLSSLSTESEEKVGMKMTPSGAFISYSFVYHDNDDNNDNNTKDCVWSNTSQMNVEREGGLLSLEKGERVLIPVYNSITRSNEAFVPVRVAKKEEEGVGVVVVTPFAVVKNQLNIPVWIRVGSSEQV